MVTRVQFQERAGTDLIVVHCAATKPSMDIGVREIRQWHVAQSWLDIGYHFVIRRNGVVEEGRAVGVIGSHVRGFNARSVGVCLVGGINDLGKATANFTPEQYASLSALLFDLKQKYPEAVIKGHRELDRGKECPSFDVQAWLKEDAKLDR